MANVNPFRGIHYSKRFVSDGTSVVIPPYDNIQPGEEKNFFTRSAYNFAHILLPQSANDDYTRSKELLEKWREKGVLEQDNSPAYYLYQQTFTALGEKHVRQTLMATVQLADFSEGIVKPHENTFGKYKADRLRILKATQCNLSHVLGMVKDSEGFLGSFFERVVFETPLMTGKTDDGADHTLWRIDGSRAANVTKFFADKSIYIVDGHHRYESALAYAKEVGAFGKPEHPAAHMLFAIANCFDPALVVLPTHRRIDGIATGLPKLEELAKRFEMHQISETDLARFVDTPVSTPSFALYVDDKLWVCTPKDWTVPDGKTPPALVKLAVHWSDDVFLREYCGITDENRGAHVSYHKDAMDTWNKRHDARAIVFHARPSVEDVTAVADEKAFMPQKSTYFFPKLAAGFVFRALS